MHEMSTLTLLFELLVYLIFLYFILTLLSEYLSAAERLGGTISCCEDGVVTRVPGLVQHGAVEMTWGPGPGHIET